MLDKAESRRVRNEIRQVLLSVWDPIGVADVPECADEYDCCVGGIYDLLTGSRSDDAIAEYLLKMSNEHMGLSFSKESTAPTIVALREIPSVNENHSPQRTRRITEEKRPAVRLSFYSADDSRFPGDFPGDSIGK